MGRSFFAGMIGLVMVGFCFLSGAINAFRTEAKIEGDCWQYLSKPEAGWLTLEGCGIDTDELVLETADGTLELFADRKQGSARHPWPEPPTWVAGYAPVMSPMLPNQPVRVVYRLTDSDLLKWLNAWERADEKAREKMLQRPDVLRRVEKPGVLMGRADRAPNADNVQTALGTRALPGLLVVTGGQQPKAALPLLPLTFGLLGVGLIVWAMVGFMRRSGAHVESAGDDLRNVDVSKVQLKLGELDELRREEHTKRKKQ